MNRMSDRSPPASTRVIYAVFDYVSLNRDRLLSLVLAVLVLAVLAKGFHIVKKEEAGTVRRFGKIVEEHTEPGIHYHLPIIDKVQVRPVKRIATHRIASTGEQGVSFTILSGDPALFEVDVVLQYTISNLRDFLYASTDPMALTATLTRQHLVNLMGQNFIDLIFTTNRELIEDSLQEQVAAELEGFGLGVELVAVSVVDVRPIDETVEAFRDVSDAVAESFQAVTQANRRKETMILRTKGQAEALVLSAEARARERVVQARAAADAFNELLGAYRDEPRQVAITRYWKRMRTIFEEATLAAVSPAGTSTIDINMMDGVGRQAPVALVSGVMPEPGTSPERPLLSTMPDVTHGLERSDKGLYDGRFHERLIERDHLGNVAPRSLLFDTLSIFEHADIVPGSRFGVQQVENQSIAAEGGIDRVPANRPTERIAPTEAPAGAHPAAPAPVTESVPADEPAAGGHGGANGQAR